MSKKIKELELNALRTAFKGVKDMVLLEPLKVDSATDFEMRKKLREKKIRVKMVKNSLVKKVFDENGVKVDAGGGPTLLIWGADSIKDLSNAVDGLLKELKKDPKAPDKFKIKTAVAEGQPVAWDLAKTLPTRKEAIGSVIAALLSPGSAIAGCLTGPASQLASILVTIEEKGKGSGDAAAPAPAAG
jgi:large subunit ribosomal protein L10